MSADAIRAPRRAALPALGGAWWDSRAYVAAAMMLSIVPLLWPAVPPLNDVPGHVGRYEIMMQLARSPELQRHWDFHWALIGNLGVDLLVWALSHVIGVVPAAKLVIASIPPLFVLGLVAVSRAATGRVSPLAAFAFPLAYAFPFQLGFVNFALASALALLAVAGWIRLGSRGWARWRGLMFVPVACALWVAHSFGWGLFGLLVFTATVVERRRLGCRWGATLTGAVTLCLPLGLPALVMLAGGASGDGGLGVSWEPVAKLVWLAELLRERFKWWDVIGAIYLYVILWTALRQPEYRYDRLLGALAAVAGLAFLVLPRLLLGGAYVDMRVLPVAVGLGLVAIVPAAGHAALAPRLALLANGFFVARTIVTTVALAGIGQAQARVLEAVPAIPRGAGVLVLVDEPCFSHWANDRLGHVASLAAGPRGIYENGQWLLAGQQLLRSRHPQTAPYDQDPSQLVYDPTCEAHPTDFHAAIRDFDRGVYSQVWTIGFAPRRLLARDVRMRWSNGVSTLYAVTPPPR